MRHLHLTVTVLVAALFMAATATASGPPVVNSTTHSFDEPFGGVGLNCATGNLAVSNGAFSGVTHTLVQADGSLHIVVNTRGRRFVDEGADFRNYTYAKYGREILHQPGRQAFQIFDKKTIPLLRDEYRMARATKARADTIDELAQQMLIDPAELRATIEAFNAACGDGTFDPSILDGKSAHPAGQPPKSNWAVRIDEPPFEAYAVTCGITFTFGGLRIDANARVLDTEDRPIPGLFAAGELVGGLFYYNYPGGSGLMAGAVFGRKAGMSAAMSEPVATPIASGGE